MKSIKANIWKYYVFSFLDMFCVFLPFMIYYFQELGFNITQIMIFSSMTGITLFFTEIPSGYIADKIGRKQSLMISVGFQIIGMIFLYQATNYYLIILAHVFNGLGIAFFSGANSAFLYDTLLVLKREKEYKKIEGKAGFITEIGVILSSIVGFFIVTFGIPFTVLVTIITHVILLLFLLTFNEPSRHKPIETISFKKQIFQLCGFIKKSIKQKQLFGFFMYSFALLGASNIIFLIYQPYFREVGIELKYNAIIFIILSVFCSVAALKAHYIERKIGVFWSLLIMPLFLVGAFLGAGLVFAWYGIVFFFLRELVRGFVHPVLNDYINKLTTSDKRATILSVQSMFSRIGFLILSLSFGFVSDYYSLRYALIIGSLLLFVFSIAIIFFLKKK